MVDSDRLSYIKSLDRYFDFTYLDKAVFFDEYFKDKNYSVVQVHDINPISDVYIEPIGFAGKFKWVKNVLTPLDYDSYTAHMPIYGYHTFKDEEGKLCLDILTDRW